MLNVFNIIKNKILYFLDCSFLEEYANYNFNNYYNTEGKYNSLLSYNYLHVIYNYNSYLV